MVTAWMGWATSLAGALFSQALAGEPELSESLPKPLGAGSFGWAATLAGDVQGRFAVVLDGRVPGAAAAAIRGGIFSTCANPHCGSGWLRLWRRRETPVFEGGWCCSSGCMAARVRMWLGPESGPVPEIGSIRDLIGSARPH
jgi:hypothetical protein